MTVHVHPGPLSHIRSTTSKLLYMTKHYPEVISKKDISKMSHRHRHRIAVLCWFQDNIRNKNGNAYVSLLQRSLRECLLKRSEGPPRSKNLALS